MKIRTDFVTNSSSSSFTVVVTIRAKRESVYITDNPYEYGSDDGGNADFGDTLLNVKYHLGSVEELARWLRTTE